MPIVIIEPATVLAEMLGSLPGYEIIGLPTGNKNNFDSLRHRQPSIVVVDVPQAWPRALKLLKMVNDASPRSRLIAWLDQPEALLLAGLARNGVTGFVRKADGKKHLMRALAAAHEGLPYCCPPCLEAGLVLIGRMALPEPNATSPFSKRESQVLYLIAQSRTNAQIAKHLFISERTVETHRKNILKKTGASKMVAAIYYAIRQGWLE